MASKPESKLTRKILDWLRSEGAWAEKVHGNIYQKGIPDIVGCIHGYFFAFEVKMPQRRTKVTPLQQAALNRIEKAGGMAGVVTSVEDCKAIFKEEGISGYQA